MHLRLSCLFRYVNPSSPFSLSPAVNRASKINIYQAQYPQPPPTQWPTPLMHHAKGLMLSRTANSSCTYPCCSSIYRCYPSYLGGPDTVNPDEWGEDNGSGTQCPRINNLNDISLAWSTTWSWADYPTDIKSYAK